MEKPKFANHREEIRALETQVRYANEQLQEYKKLVAHEISWAIHDAGLPSGPNTYEIRKIINRLVLTTLEEVDRKSKMVGMVAVDRKQQPDKEADACQCIICQSQE